MADDGEATRNVLAVAAEDEGAGRAAVQLGPPTIVLYLVQPLGADGRDLLQNGR